MPCRQFNGFSLVGRNADVAAHQVDRHLALLHLSRVLKTGEEGAPSQGRDRRLVNKLPAIGLVHNNISHSSS